MPQMSPLLWIGVYLFVTIILLFILSHFYWLPPQSIAGKKIAHPELKKMEKFWWL